MPLSTTNGTTSNAAAAADTGKVVDAATSSSSSTTAAAAVPSLTSSTNATESQRIYWQQWLMNGSSLSSETTITATTTTTTTTTAPLEDSSTLQPRCHRRHGGGRRRRQLITSSAAVRMDRYAAKAQDVTRLLRQTLHLDGCGGIGIGIGDGSGGGGGTTTTTTTTSKSRKQPQHNHDTTTQQQQQQQRDDALVLVGTCHGMPADYVQFEHQVAYPEITFMDGYDWADADATSDDEPSGAASSERCSPSPPPPPQQQQQQQQQGISSPEQPFHVVQTLQPTDSPLQKRDQLMVHLQNRIRQVQHHHLHHHHHHYHHNNNNGGGGSFIPPTCSIKFYFVPGTQASTNGGGPSSLIPACLELDGYATSMDDDDDDVDDDGKQQEDDDDEESFEGSDEEQEEMEEDVYGFGNDSEAGIFVKSDERRIPPFSDTARKETTFSRRRQRRLKRYLQISQSHSSPACLSGFLLKQYAKDRNVWKRVYCVLTEDYLWFVPRLQQPRQDAYGRSKGNPNDDSCTDGYQEESDDVIQMAPHHGRISLGRALLIESMEDIQASSLFRVPNAWEVVTGRGLTHVFRATSTTLARQWTDAIRQRLLDCYEQSLLQSAELILTDEVVARNQRIRTVAMDPLIAKWQQQQQQQQNEEKKNDMDDDGAIIQDDVPTSKSLPRLLQSHPLHSKEDFQSQVLRLGLDIAAYKEQCLHLQSMLLSQAGGGGSNVGDASHPVSSATVSQEIWESASRLLSKATDISSEVKVGGRRSTSLSSTTSLTSLGSTDSIGSSTHHAHSSRSLETLCRHVDYIITGQFRHDQVAMVDGSNKEGKEDRNNNRRRPSHHGINDPPPMDLFDMLLGELQTVAMT